MTAFQEEPPAVARQRVRRALRQARQATPMSQGDVAKKLSWSLSKVQRIEAGEVAVSVTDLRALLELYDVADEEVIAQLAADARTSRRQRWVTPPEHRTFLTAGLRQLIQFESQAIEIKAYQPVLVPGVLQTPGVAEVILDFGTNRITDEERRVRFDVRMVRQRRLFERDDGPHYFLILDESVIKRHVGGLAIMAEQLEMLHELAQRPKVHIRVVPFEKGALVGIVAPFQMLRLSDDEHDTVIYLESYIRDHILHDPEEIRYFEKVFEELWGACLTEQATMRAIAAEAAVLRSALDAESRSIE
jgi:transcriptional regulator with XRE-family HTH domain